MKKSYYSLLAGALFALTSCTTAGDEPTPATAAEPIRFGLERAISRADFEADPAGALCLSWEEGDKVGISATAGEKLLGANYAYAVTECRNGGQSALLSSVSNLYQYRWEEGQHTFYAYYPYDGSQGAGVHYLTPVSLPAEQHQRAANDYAHLKELWTMKAEPFSVEGKQQTVDLQFRGVYSIVELKLKFATASAKSRVITRVQLNSQNAPLAAPIANLTLSTTKEQEKQEPALIVNDGVNYVDVVMTAPFSLSDEQTQSIWLLVAPGAHAAGEIGLQLATADSYLLDMTIADAVTFEPNKVYRKEVAVNPADFYYQRDPSQPAVTYFKPVTTLEEVTDGEYLFGYRYTTVEPAVDYLIPVTPAQRNPIATDFATANVATYGDMGILSVDSHYVWTVTKAEGGLTFYGQGADGNNYYFLGCDKNQGFSVAKSLTEGIYNTYKGTYSDQFVFTPDEQGVGFIVQVSNSAARYLALNHDTATNICTMRNLPLAELNGSILLYKKVTE